MIGVTIVLDEKTLNVTPALFGDASVANLKMLRGAVNRVVDDLITAQIEDKLLKQIPDEESKEG